MEVVVDGCMRLAVAAHVVGGAQLEKTRRPVLGEVTVQVPAAAVGAG